MKSVLKVRKTTIALLVLSACTSYSQDIFQVTNNCSYAMPFRIYTGNQSEYNEYISIGLIYPYETSAYFAGPIDSYGFNNVYYYYYYGYDSSINNNYYYAVKLLGKAQKIPDNSIIRIKATCNESTVIKAIDQALPIGFMNGAYTYTSEPIPPGFKLKGYYPSKSDFFND
jgi:hypothetical protein